MGKLARGTEGWAMQTIYRWCGGGSFVLGSLVNCTQFWGFSFHGEVSIHLFILFCALEFAVTWWFAMQSCKGSIRLHTTASVSRHLGQSSV